MDDRESIPPGKTMKTFQPTVLVIALLSSIHGYAKDHHHHQDEHYHSKASKAAKPEQAQRVIEVIATDDMRFQFKPSLTKKPIRHGEIITFEVENEGKVTHEFSIDDAHGTKMHRAMMQKNPNMKHTDSNTLVLKAGESGSITRQFTKRRAMVFSCNEAGHYEAGMYNKQQIK
jgi:uncharacterized cupredoxin-like copper-binding protein